jgi:hypothetical protein
MILLSIRLPRLPLLRIKKFVTTWVIISEAAITELPDIYEICLERKGNMRVEG